MIRCSMARSHSLCKRLGLLALCKRLGLLAIGGLLSCGIAVAAETDVLPLAGGSTTYVDFFLQNPKVSGNLLVGLRWGGLNEAAPQKFDPENIRMVVPATLNPRSACVDIASKDGRYTAENLYAVPADVTPRPRLWAESRFSKTLVGYPLDNIAVMIRAVDKCDAAQFGTLIPALLLPRGAAAAMPAVPALVAYVNAGPDRVGLDLLAAGKSVNADIKCRGAGNDVQIAYSTICIIQPETRLAAGSYIMRVTVKERFKSVPTEFRLRIDE